MVFQFLSCYCEGSSAAYIHTVHASTCMWITEYPSTKIARTIRVRISGDGAKYSRSSNFNIMSFVLVIAWVAVKFGINITSVVLEIYYFQYNKSGIYPKFHCYPCYSQLIPYLLHIRMLCISVAMYAICHYVLNMRRH